MPLSNTSMHAPTIGVFESAQQAWLSSLVRLRRDGCEVAGVMDPKSVGSDFGTKSRPTRELLAASFTILNPRKRLFASGARSIDLGFAFANVVWTLTGSNDLDLIEAYNSRGKSFSDDGITLFGAPGYRIFHSNAGDQFELGLRQLRNDASSRRAMMHFLNPVDSAVASRDHSCISDLQFLIRDGKLICIAHMRSQSALMVMPYDLILLTMVHEAMAAALGIEPGPYHHFCGSLHYYHDEESLVERAINEEITHVAEMPAMPRFDEVTRGLLAANEKQVRRALLTGEPPEIAGGLDLYWVHFLRAMAEGWLRRRGSGLSPSLVAEIPEAYRAVLGRWRQ